MILIPHTTNSNESKLNYNYTTKADNPIVIPNHPEAKHQNKDIFYLHRDE